MTSDQALLARLKSSDVAALDEVITAYTPYVYAVLTRRMGSFYNVQDAEELSANVFFSLWQHRKRIRTEHLRGWLSKVAENEARGYLRKNKLRTVSAEDCLQLTDSGAEQLADRCERRLLLKQALASLDAQTCEIFTQYYERGLTVAEISRQMSINLSTVKSRLRRGRKKLKEELERGGITFED